MENILACYSSISLEEMAAASLMDRREQKFLLTEQQARDIILTLSGDLRILEIEGSRMGMYETMYFDTDEFTIYLNHHNGRKNRFKLRSRRYVVSDHSFLEVKQKVNTGLTKKVRMQTDHLMTRIESGIKEFISGHIPYNPDSFTSKIFNTYRRVTLVTPDLSERITLDFDISYDHDHQCVQLPNVVIAEIKTAGKIRGSVLSTLMSQLHIRPISFSKYCIGISLLYPEVKKNRFKPKILRIMAMTGGRIRVC
ncbi:MAG TPA: polyphosphate polymerase domain-containing protein [Methanospirillum sp.]|nr:polyphosphate polymerase domain-containing protein [Methanospirillum sp.]